MGDLSPQLLLFSLHALTSAATAVVSSFPNSIWERPLLIAKSYFAPSHDEAADSLADALLFSLHALTSAATAVDAVSSFPNSIWERPLLIAKSYFAPSHDETADSLADTLLFSLHALTSAATAVDAVLARHFHKSCSWQGGEGVARARRARGLRTELRTYSYRLDESLPLPGPCATRPGFH